MGGGIHTGPRKRHVKKRPEKKGQEKEMLSPHTGVTSECLLLMPGSSLQRLREVARFLNAQLKKKITKHTKKQNDTVHSEDQNKSSETIPE